MRRTKLMIILAAAFALCAGGAASAPAAPPEFVHEGKAAVGAFKLKSGPSRLLIEVPGTTYEVTCLTGTAEGTINGSEVAKVTRRSKQCTAKQSEEPLECEVKSTNPLGGKDEIITKTLKGRLGAVATVEAESAVGLLLAPASGEALFVLKSSTECLPAETLEVKGSLIGEVKPIHEAVLKGHLIYKVNAKHEQMIKRFTGETGAHELEVFGITAAYESKQETEFEETVEVN